MIRLVMGLDDIIYHLALFIFNNLNCWLQLHNSNERSNYDIMNQIKMTKTKLKDIITNLGKLEPACSSILLKGDCMHLIINPDEVGNMKKNGVTTVFTFLPLELNDCVFQSNENLADILKKIRDRLQKPSEECYFVFDNEGAGVMIDDVIHPIFHLTKTSSYTDHLYEKFYDYVDMVMTTDSDTGEVTISQTDLNKLVQSKVLKLNTDFGKIRLSKNNVPLLGSASASKPANFTASYILRQVPHQDGVVEHVLALHVNYKSMEAIHLYTVEPY